MINPLSLMRIIFILLVTFPVHAYTKPASELTPEMIYFEYSTLKVFQVIKSHVRVDLRQDYYCQFDIIFKEERASSIRIINKNATDNCIQIKDQIKKFQFPNVSNHSQFIQIEQFASK